jgi:hypothetical protein
MARAVQIVVAASLIAAWVWVLGRPLIHGLLQLLGTDRLEHSHSGPTPSRPVAVLAWLGWHRRPPVVRRRQLMLATMFATFGAFLLAVALRGRFVYLLGLMLAVLAGHLAVASYLGGRIVQARERARRAVLMSPAGRRLLRPAGSMTIRASRVSLEHELADGRFVSLLADGEHGVSTFVEELIELEWGSTVGASPAEPTVEAATGEAPTGEAATGEAATGEAATVVESADPAGRDTEGRAQPAEPEVLFTRPAGQPSDRPRRKPRPIYIHSQLDEEGLDRPRAANHP